MTAPARHSSYASKAHIADRSTKTRLGRFLKRVWHKAAGSARIVRRLLELQRHSAVRLRGTGPTRYAVAIQYGSACKNQ